MRSFLFKISLFLFLQLFMYTFFSLLIKKRVNTVFNVKLGTEKRYVVVGNSHGTYALNDSLSKVMVNCCRVGEAFYIAEEKIKRILESNEQIKGICIVLSESQLHGLVKAWVYTDSYLQRAIKSYSFLFPISMHLDLAWSNPVTYFKSILVADCNYINLMVTKKPLDGVFLHWGGYEPISESHFELNDKTYDDFNLPSWNPNIQSIKNVIQFAHDRNIQVVLTRLPVHDSYRNKTIEQYESKRKEHFSKVPFFDFSDWPIQEHELLDESHLNLMGAKRFTPYFDSLMISHFQLNYIE